MLQKLAKRSLGGLLVLILTLGPAWAQPRPLPAGSYVKVGENKLRAYTLEEFKIILHIHADYLAWHGQVPKLKLQVTKLEKLNQNRNSQIQLIEKNVKILEGEQDRLTKKWEEDNRLRHLCENKPAFGSWFAWGSAGAAGLVATVLAVILIAKD